MRVRKARVCKIRVEYWMLIGSIHLKLTTDFYKRRYVSRTKRDESNETSLSSYLLKNRNYSFWKLWEKLQFLRCCKNSYVHSFVSFYHRIFFHMTFPSEWVLRLLFYICCSEKVKQKIFNPWPWLTTNTLTSIFHFIFWHEYSHVSW